jgi:hypothetical protein
MTDKRLDRMVIATAASLLLCAGIAALASMYASGQGARFFEELASNAGSQKAMPSSWSTLRTAAVLGRMETAKGNHLYLLVLRRPGGEYRALADVGKEGTIHSVIPVGASNGFVFSGRIEALLGRIIGQRKDGDASPLDGTIKPLVLDVVETITNLEIDRLEEKDGK